MSVIGQRLKEARQRAGLSQENLGLEAGLEAESASARMNRYETGARTPTLELMERVGAVLGVPASFFYEADEMTAELLVAFHRLPKASKAKVLDVAKKGA